MKLLLNPVPVGERDTKFARLQVIVDHRGTRHVLTSSLFHDGMTGPEVSSLLRELATKIDAATNENST